MSIGIHIGKTSNVNNSKSKHKSYMDAITNDTTLLNMSAMAVFTMGPRSKAKINMAHQDINKYCANHNIIIYTHTSYIATGIWNVNYANRHEDKSRMYIQLIKDELMQGKQLGARGVVLHYSRHPVSTISETMEILSDCEAINSIRQNAGDLPKITLEMPASKPSDSLTYETASKLNILVKALDDNSKITIGWDLCIDTAHLYSGGVSFEQTNSWNDYINKLSAVARKKLTLIHLNGAEGKHFGTGKDVHIIPLSKQDAIWGHLISSEFRDFLDRTDYDSINKINLYDELSKNEKKEICNSSFYDIIKYASDNDITMIMEINRGEYNDIKMVMDVINGLLNDLN